METPVEEIVMFDLPRLKGEGLVREMETFLSLCDILYELDRLKGEGLVREMETLNWL